MSLVRLSRCADPHQRAAAPPGALDRRAVAELAAGGRTGQRGRLRFRLVPRERRGPPGVFRSIEPAWHDRNLRSISEAIESPLFFCHVRAAAGPPIQQTNCHPFRNDGWLFMHNGGIAEFARVKRELVLAIDPELYPLMLGTTDSEVLFHLALTLGLREDPVGALSRAIGFVERVGREHDVGSRSRAASR